MTEYERFLASKRVTAEPCGFEPTLPLNPKMFGFQRDVTAWAIRAGRAGVWLDTGLGKSIVQLEWSRHVHHHTGGDVLILCPLAVARQTQREAKKHGIECDVTVCRSQADVRPGINVTNYQMLKHFDPEKFAGVVVDESDILANFTGSTKRAILEAFRATPFKLDCSATPAPNDHLEIGNHADFLSVMESNEMISRWFINDASQAGNYRLKGHAVDDFWRWVASWATALSKPSDLGHEDGAYNLPPLDVREHIVAVNTTDGRDDGMLFRMPSMSATSMHDELRRTADDRAKAVADLVATKTDVPWLVWCNTDYEADAISKLIPEATEIRGSDSLEKKEEGIEAFTLGQVRILIGKPAMFGHGLNWQHCRDVCYVGLSYSFKQFYQSIRRCWRFGQTQPVSVHVVMAETEGRLLETVQRKQRDHDEMKRQMVAAMMRHGLGSDRRHALTDYNPTVPMKLPEWVGVGA